MRRFLFLLALLLFGANAQASGQTRPTVTITIDSVTHQPYPQLNHLFDDPQWRRVLDKGAPLQVSFKVEQWRKGTMFLGKRVTGTREFAFLIRKNAILADYSSQYIRPGVTIDPLRDTNLDLLNAKVFGNRFTNLQMPIPTDPGEYFYSVQVDIATLSAEDLDKVLQFQGLDAPDILTVINKFVSRQFLPGKRLPVAETKNSFKIP